MLVYIERDWAAVCGPRTNVPKYNTICSITITIFKESYRD